MISAAQYHRFHVAVAADERPDPRQLLMTFRIVKVVLADEMANHVQYAVVEKFDLEPLKAVIT